MSMNIPRLVIEAWEKEAIAPAGDLTASLMGDPPKGRSALDRKNGTFVSIGQPAESVVESLSLRGPRIDHLRKFSRIDHLRKFNRDAE